MLPKRSLDQVIASDTLIESQLERYKTLTAEKGLEAAHNEFVSRLVADLFWYLLAFGAKRAYDLYQGVADQIVEQERSAA